MRKEDFYLLTVGEFYEAIAIYRAKEDAERRHIGELVRGAALRLWDTQVGRKDFISDPARFWRMPWDEAPESAEESIGALSDEEREESIGDMLELMGKTNGKGK